VEATLKLGVSLLKGGNDEVQMVCNKILVVRTIIFFILVAHVSKIEAHGCGLLYQYLLTDIILQVSLHCVESG